MHNKHFNALSLTFLSPPPLSLIGLTIPLFKHSRKSACIYFDEYLSGIGKSLNVKAIENLLSHEEVLSNLETENLLSVWNSCLEIEGK